ncbi:MAG: Cof-type HAD-IIB family hydrolase [Defluviitaleaceae bacterium]|nr:Cof-type HAD-IIB family hydrolase [Defluviitaleaceae bacterium]
MPIKMIVCDLDKTLLRSDGTVSQYNLDALEKCRRMGIKIGIATARTALSSKRITDALSPNVSITSGGAVVKIGDESIYAATLSADTINTLLTRLMAEKTVGFINPHTVKGSFSNLPIPEEWKDYSHAEIRDFAKDPFTWDGEKIAVEMPFDLAQNIAVDFCDVETIAFSGEGWVQFAHKNATKYNGLKIATEHLGIDLKQVVAFGDDNNDIEMLTKTGYGVAMANGIDAVKKAAKYQCDTNDNDGIARWLQENVLC